MYDSPTVYGSGFDRNENRYIRRMQVYNDKCTLIPLIHAVCLSLFVSLPVEPKEPTEPEYDSYDVNRDGVINVMDAIFLQKYLDS